MLHHSIMVYVLQPSAFQHVWQCDNGKSTIFMVEMSHQRATSANLWSLHRASQIIWSSDFCNLSNQFWRQASASSWWVIRREHLVFCTDQFFKSTFPRRILHFFRLCFSVCCFPTISAFVICQSSTLRDNSMFALFLQSWNGIFQGLHGTSRFQQIFMLFLHFLFPQPCCFYLNVRQEIGVDLVDFPMKNSSLLLHRLKGMFNKINKSQEQPAKFAGRYGSWWIQGLLRVVLRKPIRIN